MSALTGPVHLLALVLVISGLQKIISPRPAADAMADAGLPIPFRGRSASGVALGVIEASIGLVAIGVPHRLATVALAGFYLALAGFVAMLRRSDSTAGCGCFGASSTPPGVAHLALNLVAAAMAGLATVTGTADIVDIIGEGIGVAVPYLALLAVGAGTVLVSPTLLAEMAHLRTSSTPRSFSIDVRNLR